MKTRIFHLLTVALALPLQVWAETPPNFQPSTDNRLAVAYNSTTVTPNQLFQPAAIANAPTVSYNRTLQGPYMIAMFDLSITYADFAGPTTDLVPGLGTNTTTYLHWLRTNVTQTPGAVLGGSANDTAAYVSPAPPATDAPHTYILYLFPQPTNFTLPAVDAGRNLSAGSMNRYNFSIQALADAAGQPVAANYFRATSMPTNSTTNGTTSPGVQPSTGSAASFKSSVWFTTVAVAVGIVMAM
ncbi:hypothetical protein M409DRAFT_20739 [Zasmidium cellare ATCC 36951]|uniref:PEBP-like protein n=1 Tax=Zasmidium cellare ATCC 36951 TaxID=1080233 RepID=A0A6A6CNU3_ZASCE|nr:uncharacterized protein M409DRAFT_20739 [Zasmidium cellare ATCC 36951]KAF2168721.1 hypothetical protein M409DRAFT_20739 [Zasmidium cellare ATCC 36951]